MSVNSSSSSLLDAPLPRCFTTKASMSIPVLLLIKAVLLLPLSVFVLYLSRQRGRQQRSSLSHSDVFTCHLAVIELLAISGLPIYFCGFYTNLPSINEAGTCLFYITFFGEMSFHILTCGERYLAVVHPVAYLRLKTAGGVRMRNLTIGGVWLLCFAWSSLPFLYTPDQLYIEFCCFLFFSFVVVSFFSLSVLCVLIRPGPGEGGRDRERLGQSKQRAFHTVMAIMVVLWLWFVGVFVCVCLNASPLLDHTDKCLVLIAGLWFGLPSCLVLPLLFLHRAGKLPCCAAD